LRLIKLSTDEFPEEAEIQAYFVKELQGRNPTGLFRFPKGWIGENNLSEGETLLFSYRNKLRFVAKAKTGRMDNTYMPHQDYPFCFEINMKTLRNADIPLDEVEHQLRTHAGLQKSLHAQGWTMIPDSERAEEIINALVSQ
jgi:hypothetical protein